MENFSEKKHFCILPWIHLNINPNGKINPCCSTTDTFNLGDIKEITLNEAWNSAGLKEIRKKILNDELPEACRSCHQQEIYGQESDRDRANEFYGYLAPEVVPSTSEDGDLGKLKLKSLDVRFSNHCNLSCRICRPISSTAWYTDAKLLGYNHIDLTKKITPTPGNIKLMAEISPLLKDLKRIFFVGGEPLLQKEHYIVLEELISLKNTDLLLDYISNFTELSFGKFSVIKYWQHFKKVSVSISLDGMERRGELLRKGLDWGIFLKNLETTRREAPHVHLVISPTVSLHNIYHLPDFIKYLLTELNFSPKDISIKSLTHPFYYSVQALPQPEKRKIEALYQNFIENVPGMQAQLEAIINFMNGSDQSEKFSNFISMSKRLDFLRDESFAQVFPEYASFY
jgi:radical SAM protein with 4Fe4S-binding SPASM domain